MVFSKTTELSSDPTVFRTSERSHRPGEKPQVCVWPPPALTAQPYTTTDEPSVSVGLPVRDVSCRRSHTECGLSCLASFI